MVNLAHYMVSDTMIGILYSFVSSAQVKLLSHLTLQAFLDGASRRVSALLRL